MSAPSLFPHPSLYLSISPRNLDFDGCLTIPNKSDEEIANKVPTGLRPEWPSSNPPRGLVGALWEQIKACWNQEPKERPTISKVVETLLTLGETYHHELVACVGDQDDEGMTGEWEHVNVLEDGTFIGLGVTRV